MREKKKKQTRNGNQEVTGNASINWGYNFFLRDIVYNQIYIFSLREIPTRRLL